MRRVTRVLSRQKPLETLYVCGGLYGNVQALDTIERLLDKEDRATTVAVFNGDFHFLDTDPASFHHVSFTLQNHELTLGNIEESLLENSESCGCNYPVYVDPNTPEWANGIYGRLRDIAQRDTNALQTLRHTPTSRDYSVGGNIVKVIHGDLTSLNGWEFAVENMEPPPGYKGRVLDNLCSDAAEQADKELSGSHSGDRTYPVTTLATMCDHFRNTKATVLASAHTCLPYTQRFDVDGGQCAVVNNGAAGLPNFRGTTHGLVSRITVHVDKEPPVTPLYTCLLNDTLRLDALPVSYNTEEFVRTFLENWPVGSDAHRSYFSRIQHGPDFDVEDAMRF